MNTTTPPSDLGFVHRTRKSGDVEVLHRGLLASTLRGADALRFLTQLDSCSPDEAQKLMARVTGNYRRGNEGNAVGHERNRR